MSNNFEKPRLTNGFLGKFDLQLGETMVGETNEWSQLRSSNVHNFKVEENPFSVRSHFCSCLDDIQSGQGDQLGSLLHFRPLFEYTQIICWHGVYCRHTNCGNGNSSYLRSRDIQQFIWHEKCLTTTTRGKQSNCHFNPKKALPRVKRRLLSYCMWKLVHWFGRGFLRE